MQNDCGDKTAAESLDLILRNLLIAEPNISHPRGTKGISIVGGILEADRAVLRLDNWG